jgi:hypothetical protein
MERDFPFLDKWATAEEMTRLRDLHRRAAGFDSSHLHLIPFVIWGAGALSLLFALLGMGGALPSTPAFAGMASFLMLCAGTALADLEAGANRLHARLDASHSFSNYYRLLSAKYGEPSIHGF